MTSALPTRARQLKALNDTIRYTMWSVFARKNPIDESAVAEVDKLLAHAEETNDVVVRGWYDLSGMRADADVMVWWHAPHIDSLQNTYAALRRTQCGQSLTPVWSAAALHRPAEFNKAHIPAFLDGEEPKNFVCVYPFVRSFEWYLLPETERREMLAEHGRMAREYPDVRANTVASFALSDYEWILAFEGDELHRIVDLMRHLRSSTARRHVRVEVPFFTGRRVPLTHFLH